MTTKDELKHLRTTAHWRARIVRVQRELDDKKRLRDKISIPAKRDLDRYIDHLKKTLAWLQKMV
jgi:hypothetical protein